MATVLCGVYTPAILAVDGADAAQGLAEPHLVVAGVAHAVAHHAEHARVAVRAEMPELGVNEE